MTKNDDKIGVVLSMLKIGGTGLIGLLGVIMTMLLTISVNVATLTEKVSNIEKGYRTIPPESNVRYSDVQFGLIPEETKIKSTSR